MENEELTRTIIGCAISVHRALGPGFLESVYRNALAHELSKAGLDVHCEKRIRVRYDCKLVSDFFADMLIQNSVLIENKAVLALNKTHEVQLVNYLAATQIETGLLLNFGAQRLQLKRKSRVYRQREEDSTG
ncbi:MAG TPA: GxxExxY protein [Steroidobacteraceae bacterium]|nr:GxxExxY protein [Steroidobacteraceae bacterium]